MRSKKIKGVMKGGAVSIGGIVSSNPEIALNRISTAIFQFVKSDEVLTLAKDNMLKWGFSSNESDVIISNADDITSKNINNDIIVI